MIRGFIVGCPRSGTTLLQAMVGAHSQIFTAPESHFFRKTFRGWRAFVFRGLRASEALAYWLRRVDLVQYLDRVPRFSLTRQPVINAFVDIMDDLARAKGCACWIEKTPAHIFVVDHIERTVPGARFIHIIRDGRAVVASLMDAKRRYPEAHIWQRPLEEFVRLWNSAVLESARHVGKETHFFVSYEALVSAPRRELMALCRFLGLEFEEEMLEQYRDVGKNIVRYGRPWISNVVKPIQTVGLQKYHTVLTEEERAYVERHLVAIPEPLRKAMEH